MLRWLGSAIDEDPDLELLLVVTGMHLQEYQGSTASEIHQSGLPIAAQVPFFGGDDSPVNAAGDLGRGVASIANVLAELNPDWVVLLGDRAEAMSSALAAHALRIPIAHIHGGESTVGALDDGYRHAITKLSSLHLPAADPYRQRIIQMGEDPRTVHNVGALAVESIQRTSRIAAVDLSQDLGLTVREALLLTYHPVTLESDFGMRGLQETLVALRGISERPLVITGANSDPGGRQINQRLQEFAAESGASAVFVPSLGHQRFISLLSTCRLTLGNSSSSYIEAAILGTPAINIGSRQLGRLQPDNVVSVPPDAEAIGEALAGILARPRTRRPVDIYGDGGTSTRIVQHLKLVRRMQSGPKTFFDLPPQAREKGTESVGRESRSLTLEANPSDLGW
jgi:UDP-hydrolysing UDP-N-acetyl-D-glucosamine 2-epimerase